MEYKSTHLTFLHSQSNLPAPVGAGGKDFMIIRGIGGGALPLAAIAVFLRRRFCCWRKACLIALWLWL